MPVTINDNMDIKNITIHIVTPIFVLKLKALYCDDVINSYRFFLI